MDTFDSLQNDPNIAVLRGAFVILHRYGHWYFVGSQLDGQNRKITSMAVLSPTRAKKTLAETPSAVPKRIEDLGSGFVREVESKVLPKAEDYLQLFHSGVAAIAAGFHADTMQRAQYSKENEQGFLRTVSQMMLLGESLAFITFQ
jgi:hypothetical protein